MMADKPQPTAAPQSTTSPPNPPYTPRSTSIPDDSETEFEPTPLHSPGGPQYEDLPPSYDFALSDARSGSASLDASQIEAHRVSVNEGPDEPEVWEYRMRGESAENDETQEHEEAPAYEGYVPIQHVANNQDIPVGRVGDFHTSISAGRRGVPTAEDPPHSFPGAEFELEGFGRRGHRNQPWTPFGAPSYGPFGPPGNGPFGPVGNGPFSRGRGFNQRGGQNRSGRGRPGREARSGSSQDLAAFGQNMGRLGEEFGRRMGNWGEQLGRQAGAIGEQIGRQAGAIGQQIGRDAGSWAPAYDGRAMTSQTISTAGPSNTEMRGPSQDDEPPSYQGPVGAASQETGVLHSDRKADTYLPEKIPQSPSEKPSVKTLGKQKATDYHDNDDSSISSESSASTSSSDSEDDDYDEAQVIFLRRIESINKAAEAAATNGKKSREEIEHERDVAIAKATKEKEQTELKIAQKQSRRTQLRELRNRRRELTRDYRKNKKELREEAQSNGKGKGKAKRSTEWKELKREYKGKRRVLKRERMEVKRAWKRETREERKAYKEGSLEGGASRRL